MREVIILGRNLVEGRVDVGGVLGKRGRTRWKIQRRRWKVVVRMLRSARWWCCVRAYGVSGAGGVWRGMWLVLAGHGGEWGVVMREWLLTVETSRDGENCWKRRWRGKG